ncbi:MAG: RluA family pseudouridine synthase [Zetaproteobacteria bacterium]|nr:MAG: RluA family pseudouridine synthase [Zetaproteobacteria bacterium]
MNAAKALSGALTVAPEQHGRRLDTILAEHCGISRARVRRMLQDGLVEGPSCKPSAKVKAGERYCWQMPPNEPLSLLPEAIPLDILFEDEHLIIINKPAGMVVHPAHGHTSGTLVHALLHHCPNLPGINGIERPGIVHRLDKDTSGSLVVAKSEQAMRGLAALFASHELRREYRAWCRGAPNWHDRRIDLPIARHPRHRQKMAVVAHGRTAITDAHVEARLGPFSALRLTLHTGRTHQIRVHLSHLGLPLLGDTVYARRFNPGRDIPEPARSAIRALRRQALHAELLAFRHPISGQTISVRAPLPGELVSLDHALHATYD